MAKPSRNEREPRQIWPGRVRGSELAAARGRPLEILNLARSVDADIVELEAARASRLFVLKSPQLIKQLFARTDRGVSKQQTEDERLSALFGNGLLTSAGDLWGEQRSQARRCIAKRAPLYRMRFTEIAEQFASDLAREGGTEDLFRDVRTLTLRSLFQGLLAEQVSFDEHGIIAALDVVIAEAYSGSQYLLVEHPQAMSRFPDATSALAFLRSELGGHLGERHEPGGIMDGISRRHGGDLSRDSAIAEVVTLLVAGHETTAIALCWVIAFVAGDRDLADMLRCYFTEERPPPAALTAEGRAYALLRATLNESLRLRPPIYVMGRVVEAPMFLGGYEFAAGDNILASPWLTHRDERFWENAETFLPDRWRSDPGSCRSPAPTGAFFPFGFGSRVCVGESFARQEIECFLRILLTFGTPIGRWEVDQIPLTAALTARPSEALHLEFTPSF